MKKLYAFLVVAFCTFATEAQIVAIPDPEFKAELLNQEPNVDTNGDGEIQESEALVVTRLSFSLASPQNVIGIKAFSNLEQLSFSSYFYVTEPVDISGMSHIKNLSFHKSGMPTIDIAGLTSLESISFGYCNIHFLNFDTITTLKSLSYYNSSFDGLLDLSHNTNLLSFKAFGGSHIDAVNLSGLVNLQVFECKSTDMAAIDTHDLVSLKSFRLSNYHPTQLDFSNNSLLEYLWIPGNQTGNLDFSNLTELTTLYCAGNEMTAIDLSHNTKLDYLNCSENQLTSIDLSNLHKLRNVDVRGNLFTSLDFSSFTDYIGSPGDAPVYEVRDNPNLVSLNLKNGKRDRINVGQPFDCPNLIYICLDEDDIENMAYTLEAAWITDIQINSYCDFVPGGSYNTIAGNLALHPMGCDNATAYPMRNVKINLSNGTNTGVAFTDSNGHYDFYTQEGNFTIMPEIELPLFGINPENETVTFPDNLSHTETRNFCVSPVGQVQNLEVAIIPVSPARPGFDASYQLVLHNTGNQVLSGSVDFSYNDAVFDFVSANPVAESQTPGHMVWNYTNLLPFESRTIHVTLNLNSPMETPAVNLGDVLHFDASFSPIIAGVDNHFALNQVVVGSFDPNDKTCLEGDTMTPEQVGKYLHYLIRFQNSGTAAAENIVVKDMIDTEKYDVSSLELVSSSHPHQTRVSGNKVEFIFEGIHLPAEIDDEPASHGYVVFKIKTKENLVLGNEVSNIADIYFDYNFPITTEPATTTVALLGKNNFEDKTVSVYPNPVQNKLQISAKENIHSVQLFDLQGRLIRTATTNNVNVTFDMSGHATGVYFVKIHTEKGVKTEKIIKE